MAHPKSRISKSRKNKRRTHHKAAMPQLAICKTTGEAHMMHRDYKGQIVIQAKEAEDTEV